MNAKNSQSVKYDNSLVIDKAMRLTEMLYCMPTHERLGFVRGIIQGACEGNTMLKRILTNQHFLSAGLDKRYLYWRGRSEYPNIAKVANRYCRRYLKAGVREVVSGKLQTDISLFEPRVETWEEFCAPAMTVQSVLSIINRFLYQRERKLSQEPSGTIVRKRSFFEVRGPAKRALIDLLTRKLLDWSSTS